MDSLEVYLESGGKLECMLSPKNQERVIKQYVDSLDPKIKINWDVSPIKTELLPEEQIFTKNYIIGRRDRQNAPIGFIKAVLDHKNAEKLMGSFAYMSK